MDFSTAIPSTNTHYEIYEDEFYEAHDKRTFNEPTELNGPHEAGFRTNVETAATAVKYACIAALVVSVATIFFSLLTAPVGASLLITLLNAPIIAFSVDGIMASSKALEIASSSVPLINHFSDEELLSPEQLWQKLIDKCLASTTLIKHFLPSNGFYASQQSASKAWEEKLKKGFVRYE